MERKTAGILCLFALAGCAPDSAPDAENADEARAHEAVGEVVNELTLDSKNFPYDLESPIPFQISDGEAAADADAAVQEESQALVTSPDDRVRSDATVYPFRAQAALRRTSQATDAYCTGFRITPRHILTAAHCMYWQGTWQTYPDTMRVVYFQNGTNTGTKYTPKSIYVPKAWTDSATANYTTAPNWNYDYALVSLPEPNNTNGWFDFQAETTTSSSLTATFSGYPGASASCSAGVGGRCAGYQYRSTGKFDALYSNMFVTRADWESGQSGGPIYYLPSGQTQYKAIGIISNERLPASGQPFVVGTHGNRGLRITKAIQDDLCAKINVDRPSTLVTHFCYH